VTALALALALVIFGGDVGRARAALCVIVDPILELGCDGGRGACTPGKFTGGKRAWRARAREADVDGAAL
jgi:hypothetical protein